MANSKEIRGRIGSVGKIKKLTHAMELIAASKLRKARDQMEASRPYAKSMRSVIAHIASSHSEYHHPYLVQREVKRVGVIVVSTDRGFCGGLNNNLFRKSLVDIKAFTDKNIEVDLALIGHRSEMFYSRLGFNIVAYAHHLGDSPSIESLIGSVKVMLEAYDQGRIDQLVVYYNRFENTITQKPISEVILPLVPDAIEDQHHWDYIYEPEAKSILNQLLTRYIESQVYQAVVENLACGQAATMMAMKNATDNAREIIDDLKLEYNKARQASITKELAEIVSGADAID